MNVNRRKKLTVRKNNTSRLNSRLLLKLGRQIGVNQISGVTCDDIELRLVKFLQSITFEVNKITKGDNATKDSIIGALLNLLEDDGDDNHPGVPPLFPDGERGIEFEDLQPTPTDKPVEEKEVSLTPTDKPAEKEKEMSLTPTDKPGEKEKEMSLTPTDKPGEKEKEVSLTPTDKQVEEERDMEEDVVDINHVSSNRMTELLNSSLAEGGYSPEFENCHSLSSPPVVTPSAQDHNKRKRKLTTSQSLHPANPPSNTPPVVTPTAQDPNKRKRKLTTSQSLHPANPPSNTPPVVTPTAQDHNKNRKPRKQQSHIVQCGVKVRRNIKTLQKNLDI